MGFKKLHRDHEEKDNWPDSARRRGSGVTKQKKLLCRRVCFLMPSVQGELRKLACHLSASPGGYTQDPLRVTCSFCNNRKDFKKILFATKAAQVCTCNHRRGQHLGTEGLGRCIECVPCLGFTLQNEVTHV